MKLSLIQDASARDNVTAHPAASITIRAAMMYLSFTFEKKASMKRKSTANTAVTNAKIAATTIIEQTSAPAGWM